MRIVFDLDGTLALNEHRVHYIRGPHKDYDAFQRACRDDLPNATAIAALHAHASFGHAVEIWSARSDLVRAETVVWLQDNGVPAGYLTRMRCHGDSRPDVVVKREWLNEARAQGLAPDLVYDDRDCVVAMWREEGVACFQVAPGPF